MSHSCPAIIVHCIDFRFQKRINEWLKEKIGHGNYDRVAWAGGVLDLEGILKQIGIAVRLHGIRHAILINHEDCGAYGAEGTAERHANDLRRAAREIQRQHPHLSVELYYLYLDGTFEPIT
jgi:carbonic anhydrase